MTQQSQGQAGQGAQPAIRVHQLDYVYPDGKPALCGVDFEVQTGESVALVGPNGAGKSTLLLHLNGILPSRARWGLLTHSHSPTPSSKPRTSASPRVWIDGLAVEDRSLREVRRRVGLLFQDPDDQLFCNTVLEDVAFGARNRGLSLAEAKTLARDCLRRVGLGDLGDRPPHHLSVGERRRVALAGVLACEPTVLALDEPTANLDPRSRRQFIELLRSLPGAKLIATHDLEMVLELCPRTILLDAGRIIADSATPSLLNNQILLENHGLERPLSLALQIRP